MAFLPFHKYAIDLTNKKFGRLTALGPVEQTKYGAKWLCACECGGKTTVLARSLRRGATKSCGCLNRELASARNSEINKTHGRTNTPEFRAWQGMWQRCGNVKDKNYNSYGGRGITVSEQWRSFEPFLEFIGPRPSPDHSIDRIDVNGNYEPGNVRWAISAVQNRNKRSNLIVSAFGKIVVLSDFFDDAHSAAYQRARRLIKKGWAGEDAIRAAGR